jgi:putative transposase
MNGGLLLTTLNIYKNKMVGDNTDHRQNPMKAGLCELPEHYRYSSTRYYELNEDEWGFITHYAEHI